MDYGLVLFTSDRGITPAAAAKLADDHGFTTFYVPEHTHIPIKREAARKETSPLRAQQLGRTSTTELGTDRPGGTTAQLPVPTGASGRQIAEAFFNAHPSNPLFPTRESS